MRNSVCSAPLAILTRLLFPLEDEEFGVQYEQFRQRLFELPALVHALANRLDPRLGNILNSLLALDHEGERPEGVTLAIGAVTGGLAATTMSKGERAGKGVGREFKMGDNLTFAPPKIADRRAGGCVLRFHSDSNITIRYNKKARTFKVKLTRKTDRLLPVGQDQTPALRASASIRLGVRDGASLLLKRSEEAGVKELLTHYTRWKPELR
jgi:hypothetical protein